MEDLAGSSSEDQDEPLEEAEEGPAWGLSFKWFNGVPVPGKNGPLATYESSYLGKGDTVGQAHVSIRPPLGGACLQELFKVRILVLFSDFNVKERVVLIDGCSCNQYLETMQVRYCQPLYRPGS